MKDLHEKRPVRHMKCSTHVNLITLHAARPVVMLLTEPVLLLLFLGLAGLLAAVATAEAKVEIAV